MRLSTLDWTLLAAFFVANVALGLFAGRRDGAGRSLVDYFLSGRRVPWWLAGTSMVATTFSADTPLAVTGMVARHGIAGNWLWWNAVASGMLTVFFFAALWRRAGVTTDAELTELRYGGRPASALRAFRAAYLAVPINLVIIGWVNLAMAKILAITVGLPKGPAVALCLALTGLYVAASGLWGVLVTDAVQFVVMLLTAVALAVVAVRGAGGIAHIREALPAGHLDVVPDVGAAWMPAVTFAVYVGVQWWAAWYPGAEPGGGGYVAQRIFSARTERDGVLATLWFNVAHYAVRSWPWVLTALAASVLHPHLADPETGYVRVMIDLLPPGLRGLMMAGFLAAYMSTVSTHLNWGASYLVSDLYKRFARPDADDAHYVRVARVATVFTAVAGGVVTLYMGSIAGAWKILLALGAGTGLVLILRWYWWRINAWSEIAAMVGSLVASLVLLYGVGLDPDDPREFAHLMLGTLGFTTVAWVAATFATKPESEATLVAFYRRVRPHGPGWARIAALAAPPLAAPADGHYRADPVAGALPGAGPGLGVRLRDWALGCVLVYFALFGTGKVLLGEWALGLALLAGAAVAGGLLARDLAKHGV